MRPDPPVVIFDLDGTLVDSAPGIAAALNTLGLAPQPVSVARVRGLVSFGADRLVGEALSLRPDEIDEALASFRKLYAVDPCRSEDVYPGVHKTLRALTTWGVRLGVCTNKPQGLAEIVIDRVDLASLLPVVVGSRPERASKPAPSPLREAITMLAPGNRAILVGDSMVDAETARAAGIAFVHAAFGYGAIDTGMDCAGSIDAMPDLLSIVTTLLDLEHRDVA